MASTTTQLTIVNRALQLLGFPSISSLQENSRGAKAMNRAYQPVLLSTLRENFWNFSIVRAQLAASATKPAFGRANFFPLPGDFLMLAPPDPERNYNSRDWQIEGQQIASNEGGPLYIRYISSNVTESMFDVCFDEAFAAKLGMATCEELTNSNSKIQNLSKAYDDAINQARRRNAFESRPVKPPVDRWITARF